MGFSLTKEAEAPLSALLDHKLRSRDVFRTFVFEIDGLWGKRVIVSGWVEPMMSLLGVFKLIQNR